MGSEDVPKGERAADMVFEDFFETGRKAGPTPRYFSVDSVDVFYMIRGRDWGQSADGSTSAGQDSGNAFVVREGKG